MEIVQYIRQYKIIKDSSRDSFDERTCHDSYRQMLDQGDFLTEKGQYFYIEDEKNESVGYAIFDEYKHDENSLIVYLRIYRPIPIEDKKDIIRGAMENIKGQSYNQVYFRAQVDDKLLNEALTSLGFTVTGEYITNVTGNGFSFYKVYKKSI